MIPDWYSKLVHVLLKQQFEEHCFQSYYVSSNEQNDVSFQYRISHQDQFAKNIVHQHRYRGIFKLTSNLFSSLIKVFSGVMLKSVNFGRM